MRRITAVLMILVLSLSVGAVTLAQQDPKPAKRAVKAKNLEEVLRPFIGRKCRDISTSGLVHLDFVSPKAIKTLDVVGKDFVRLSFKGGKFYYPFTSIRGVSTR